MPGVVEGFRDPLISRFRSHAQFICFAAYLPREHVRPVDRPLVGVFASAVFVALRLEL